MEDEKTLLLLLLRKYWEHTKNAHWLDQAPTLHAATVATAATSADLVVVASEETPSNDDAEVQSAASENEVWVLHKRDISKICSYFGLRYFGASWQCEKQSLQTIRLAREVTVAFYFKFHLTQRLIIFCQKELTEATKTFRTVIALKKQKVE